MKKVILSLFMLGACVMGAKAQWLYEVSKDSTAKASYIVASCPLINPMGVVSHSDAIKNAITKTDQVYFEVNKDAYASTSSMLFSRNIWRWISAVRMCRKSMAI